MVTPIMQQRLIIEHYCCFSTSVDEEDVHVEPFFGYVAVTPNLHTLQHVRTAMKAEWDWEETNDDNVDAYQFVLDGKIRVSTKQETQITVQEILAQNTALSFRPKIRRNQKRTINSTANNNNDNYDNRKKKQKLNSPDEESQLYQTPEATVTVTTETSAPSSDASSSLYCTPQAMTSNTETTTKSAEKFVSLKQPPLPSPPLTSSTKASSFDSPTAASPSSCNASSSSTSTSKSDQEGLDILAQMIENENHDTTIGDSNIHEEDHHDDTTSSVAFTERDFNAEENLSAITENNQNQQYPDADFESDPVTEEEDVEMILPSSSESNNNRHINTTSTNEQHTKHNMAIEKSVTILNCIRTLIQQNPLFCSSQRREQFMTEIQHLLTHQKPPNTVIGVLGSTGVGKSALLNALLEEANILPTSGSRGCTATVVELRWNSQLEYQQQQCPCGDDTTMVPVYTGRVEFISMNDWATELKILLDECSTEEQPKHIYARIPDRQVQPEAAAAWEKINQVYGSGTMGQYHKHPTDHVYQILSKDARVWNLLIPPSGNATEYNSIVVQEGTIPKSQASSLQVLDTKMLRSKKGWAKAFRRKINDYVYRKGDGKLPQTWPLIRKVQLEGPWHVLSTGAVLVDLPGVRDANVARARVSEQYLQNCHQIWIAAPIKRAVDDGTAKELLGEQFKRRLLMDGQYGNVSFICTQTDDIESTETMADHEDIARSLGLWEDMQHINKTLGDMQQNYSDFQNHEDELKSAYVEAKEATQEVFQALKDAQKENDQSDGRRQQLEELQDILASNKAARDAASGRLRTWQKECQPRMARLRSKIRKKQLALKSLSASVRNHYSIQVLRSDFRAGLEELVRSGNDVASNQPTGEDGPTFNAVPDNFEMDVFCISANDYLKIRGIKDASDGPPNTFSNIEDTQIPSLRNFVHQSTAKHCSSFVESFVDMTSNLLDRVKLIAMDAKGMPTSRTAQRYKATFELHMNSINRALLTIANEFETKTGNAVLSTLRPSLEMGAAKGRNEAMATVVSWGSANRRNKHHRSSEQNGLHFMTYRATTSRNGVFVSPTAGEINMNQELLSPVEKEFSANWQRIMDTALFSHLSVVERQLTALCTKIDQDLASAFTAAGLSSEHLLSLRTTATRASATSIKNAVSQIKITATSCQRDLNRSLLPKIEERMSGGYTASSSAPGGTGKFSRMKYALESHARSAMESMFSEATAELLHAIKDMVNRLATMISDVCSIVRKAFETVYSILWDDQDEETGKINPFQQQSVRQCRDRLLPSLQEISALQKEVLDLMGIDHEELELNVLAVESFEAQFSKKIETAKIEGNFFDLCDSSEPTNPSRFNHRQNICNQSSSKKGPALFSNKIKFVSRSVTAPPGKLGITLDTASVFGPTVTEIKNQSTMVGKLSVGEIIAAVNGIETKGMSAAECSSLLFQTSSNKRLLTILTEDKSR